MKLKLPEGLFRAYLFDCDGTIADSMPLHHMAWKKSLAEWNCEFSEELFYAWGGRPTAEIISTLNQQHGLSMPVEKVVWIENGIVKNLNYDRFWAQKQGKEPTHSSGGGGRARGVPSRCARRCARRRTGR